jgi:hypothetical protein
MAYTFDSLGYAKRLRDGGVPRDQAEAQAEAARDFIMAELVTKSDLLAVRADVAAISTDLLATEHRLQTELHNTKQALQAELHNNVETLKTSIETLKETLSLRLTVRLGTMIVVGIGALAALLKLT